MRPMTEAPTDGTTIQCLTPSAGWVTAWWTESGWFDGSLHLKNVGEEPVCWLPVESQRNKQDLFDGPQDAA